MTAVACRRCRTPLADGDRFCGACGAECRRPPDSWPLFWPVLRLWIALLAIHLVLGLAVRAFDDDAAMRQSLESAAMALAIVIVAIAAWHDRAALRPLLQSHGFHDRDALLVPAVLAALLAFGAVYFWACRKLHVPFLRSLDDFREAGWPIWTAFVSITVITPIWEEVAFRGVILGRLQRFMQPLDVLLLQAAMFSVLHLSPMIFVSHFGIGLALGWVRVRTQRLLPAIALHAAWNSWVLIGELLGV